jgi:hypothetical protein
MIFADQTPRDRLILAKELGEAFQEQRAPFFPAGNLEGWISALGEVMVQGDLECAIYAARHVTAAFPTAEFPRNICAVLDRLPPADDRFLPLPDRSAANVQVVRRPHADTVILLFSDFPPQFGLPLPVIHRWLGRLPASLIYLADDRRNYCLNGIRSLGPDREATLTALRNITMELGARRILCYGVSAGGFPALHYGLDLGAEAILALGSATNLTLEFNANLRQEKGALRLQRQWPGSLPDLRALFGAVRQPPRTLLVYGESNWDDRLHALHLSALPSVTLKAVPKFARHNVTPGLIRRDEYQALLDWFLAS